MAHITVAAGEEILDKEIKVLDHGFVRLVDYMGSDARIVQTARVSYGEGTKTLREDAGLIDYLLRHEHTSPFEHVVFEFHAKMPIFVARQWIRHRTARLNEISGRYSVIQDEFYVPEPQHINFQSKDNKQGRDVNDVPPELREKVVALLAQDQETVYKNYEEMIDDDIARELARINSSLDLYRMVLADGLEKYVPFFTPPHGSSCTVGDSRIRACNGANCQSCLSASLRFI